MASIGQTRLPKQEDDTRIVGGFDVKPPHSQPWMAALVRNRGCGWTAENECYGCGATLISRGHVLTAAHCERGQYQFAVIGDHDKSRNDGEIYVKVTRFILHPKAKRRHGEIYDLSLVHLLKNRHVI